MILRSLRSQLLVWLLAPLAIVAALGIYVSYRSGMTTATLVHDRLLLGSARTIAEQIAYSENHFQLSIPPAAIEMLDAGSQDHVYYRIEDSEGRLIAGDRDLALPAEALASEAWFGFDSELRGHAIRTMAFSQPVPGASARGPVTIEIAQTVAGRDSLARQIWLHSVREQLLMLMLVGGLLILGLRGGLKPLIALRDRMQRRTPRSLDAIDVHSVPTEMQPMIAAFNDYAVRLTRHVQLHSRFIGDASHQLRTPLAVLNMQIAFCLRQDDPVVIQEGLRAIRGSVQRNIRLINQLLAFTEAETAMSPALMLVRVRLGPIACLVIEELALLAESKSIDLGFEASDPDLAVLATEHLIHVLTSNLVDNALRYTQVGGVVTVRIFLADEGEIALQVIDNGPGIPTTERERVFERFYRVRSSDSDGCGLGLSIVRESAAACEARIDLQDTGPEGGLTATIMFPNPRQDGTLSPDLNGPYRRTAEAAT